MFIFVFTSVIPLLEYYFSFLYRERIKRAKILWKVKLVEVQQEAIFSLKLDLK